LARYFEKKKTTSFSEKKKTTNSNYKTGGNNTNDSHFSQISLIPNPTFIFFNGGSPKP
jgi:hypothetical protein